MTTEILIYALIIAAIVAAGYVLKRFAAILRANSASSRWFRKTLLHGLEKGAPTTAIGFALGFAVLGSPFGWERHAEGGLFSFTLQGITLAASEILIRVGFGFFFFQCAELLGHWLGHRAKKSANAIDDMLTPILVRVLRVIIVGLVILEIAHVVTGSEIKTILAGLGIGGLAVALAAQDTLKNMLGAVVIFMEKPFNLGDRINYEGHDGTIESVGLRSSKMRRLDGHLVTIPNGNLSSSVIHNVAKRPYIRRVFNISITYQTPPEKIREAKEILEDILKDHEGMVEDFPPRVYFSEFKASSLDFLCIYWYHPPAYWDYLAFTERVNTAIVERLNAAGIDFAFPTQTLHIRDLPGMAEPSPSSYTTL